MRLLQRTMLTAAAVALFAVSTSAQATTGGGVPNLSSATAAQASQESAAAASTSKKTDSEASPASTTDKPTPSQTGSAITTGVITGSGSAAETSISLRPSTAVITGDATATDGGALTGLPTLSGAYKIYPASVPPTQNAPYMQHSTLPEGTVFIVVGAVLGFMAMSVLLWRALVAWSLHRSVKRAAMHQNMTDKKDLFRTPVAPFYKDYHDRDSTISLGGMGKSGRKEKKAPRPTTGSGLGNPSSLFFSPTAGAAAAGGQNTPGNRASSYLPAGYYAAGASSPANGNSHVQMGQNISMSNLGPGTGYPRPRSMGQSPPDSPSLTTDRSHMASNSTLNLNTAYNGDQRAPSAYLEDLFDAENRPHNTRT